MVEFRVLEGKADFWFIRHGESEGNRAGLMQGRRHSHLTGAGREQARTAGRWFRERGLAVVLTSPLERARETASIVAAETGLPGPETLEGLTEIDIGAFTGLSLTEAAGRHPRQHREFLQASWEGVAGAERIDELYDRAMAVWEVLLRRAAAGQRSILSVTHSGFMQWIIKTTVGQRQWMPLFSATENCCVSHLRVDNRDLDGGGRTLLAVWHLVNVPIA